MPILSGFSTIEKFELENFGGFGHLDLSFGITLIDSVEADDGVQAGCIQDYTMLFG